jgi:hypothetical protein
MKLLSNDNVLEAEFVGKGKRVKRTEKDMLASFEGDTLGEAAYLRDRVAKLEDKIAELLGAVSGSEVTDLVLKGREHLAKYLP